MALGAVWRGGARAAELGSVFSPDGEDTNTFIVPPVPPAGDYRVRAISTWYESIGRMPDYDESDGVFTIVE